MQFWDNKLRTPGSLWLDKTPGEPRPSEEDAETQQKSVPAVSASINTCRKLSATISTFDCTRCSAQTPPRTLLDSSALRAEIQ
jgi:hypothetical protein